MHIILYDITFKNNFSQVGCSKHLEDTLKHQIKKRKRFCEAPNVSKTSAPCMRTEPMILVLRALPVLVQRSVWYWRSFKHSADAFTQSDLQSIQGVQVELCLRLCHIRCFSKTLGYNTYGNFSKALEEPTSKLSYKWCTGVFGTKQRMDAPNIDVINNVHNTLRHYFQKQTSHRSDVTSILKTH